MSQKSSIEAAKAFTPTSTQEEFLKSTAPEVLLSGGFGAGKSRVGCEKGFMLNCRYPGNRGLIVRKNFSDVRSSTVEQTLIEEVIPEDHIADWNQGKHIIEHFTGQHDPNGAPVNSEIHYHGLSTGRSSQDDDLPRKIGGHQYSWIFVDEGVEITEGSWNQLQGRLRYNGKNQGGVHYKVPFRQIFTATNPAGPSHWMYQRFFEPSDDKKDDVEVYRMTAEELVRELPDDKIPPDYVERMKSGFSGMYYERYFEGKWVGAEGVVYDEYERDAHAKSVEELQEEVDSGWEKHRSKSWQSGGESVWATPPKDWKIYRSIDFGYRHPFVCQWWARSPEDESTFVLFRELFKTEELIEDVAKQIQEESQGMNIERTVADPAQAEDKATLQRHGVHSEEAKKDISAGIQAVKEKMAKKADGVPRLIFMKNALCHPPDSNLDDAGKPVCSLDEVVQYSWKDDDDEPVKENDHGMDAMRYLIYTLSQGTTFSRSQMEEIEEMFNSGGF